METTSSSVYINVQATPTYYEINLTTSYADLNVEYIDQIDKSALADDQDQYSLPETVQIALFILYGINIILSVSLILLIAYHVVYQHSKKAICLSVFYKNNKIVGFRQWTGYLNIQLWPQIQNGIVSLFDKFGNFGEWCNCKCSFLGSLINF
jgi:hypothetical protein